MMKRIGKIGVLVLIGMLLCVVLCSCGGDSDGYYSGGGYSSNDYSDFEYEEPSSEEAYDTSMPDELENTTTTESEYYTEEEPIGYGDGNHDTYGGFMDEQHGIEEDDSKEPSSYFKQPTNYTVTASDGYVNVRRGPSTNYAAIATIDTGETVSALAQEGDWVYCKMPAGQNGWVHLAGLTPITMTEWQAVMPNDYQKLASPMTKTVTAGDGANLRVGPDANDYGVLTNVPKGQTVEVTAKSGDWYFCYFAQTCGWTHASNLS